MSLYFLDASALVKYYILEPGSTWVRGLADDTANTISISDASIAESAAAFAILCRTRRISQRTRESAFHALMRDVARGLLKAMPVMPTDFQLAAYLTQQHPLKAYDAVQLAVALRYNQVMNTHGLTATFVSGDDILIKAAQVESLRTDNPFDHISPQDTPQANRATS